MIHMQDYYRQKEHLSKGNIAFCLESLRNNNEAKVTEIMATVVKTNAAQRKTAESQT